MPRKDNPDKIMERVIVLETDMKWIKRKLDAIDRRAWWTLGSVVVFGVISIIIALKG